MLIMSNKLTAWHRPRVRNLVKAGADFLAVETIPALKEAIAVVRSFSDVKLSQTYELSEDIASLCKVSMVYTEYI